MGSPVQFQFGEAELNPYVRLIWAKDYWPSIYDDYPPVIFPTDKSANIFAAGSYTMSDKIIRAEVYDKDDNLLHTYGE